MAAAKSRPAKGAANKKSTHGRMPTKRSINLVLVDENKINPLKAILGIVLIVALAALFGKYLVADRLVAVTQAKARVSRLNDSLSDAEAAMAAYGDVEQTYAHYTYAGMKKAELEVVDRTEIMDLVAMILDSEEKPMDFPTFRVEFAKLIALFNPANGPFKLSTFNLLVDELAEKAQPPERFEKAWSVVGNLLTVEMVGPSLEAFNELAKEIEKNPIVNSCIITTANKGAKVSVSKGVWARLIIYLQLPPEEVTAP